MSQTLTECYLLAPGVADSPRDLEAGLLAHLLRGLHVRTENLYDRLRAEPPGWERSVSPRTLTEFARELDDILGALDQVCVDFEQGYLVFSRFQREMAEIQVQHKSFLDQFHGRLTYVGAESIPKEWSFLGWIHDDPNWPLAISRDTGHVVLASGIQGYGKTVMATVLGEGALTPGWPISSDHGPPTALCSFYIEEHDRLPQILDGLKPNPRPEDLRLLKERLNLGGGQGFERIRLVAAKAVLDELRPRLLPYEDLGLEVMELRVRLPELGLPGLEAMLGADDGTRVVQRLLDHAQAQGRRLSLDGLRDFIAGAGDLNTSMKRTAYTRLAPLEEIASPADGPGMWDLFGPGVATAVYLGGPHMGRSRMAAILVGLLYGLLMPSEVHGEFHRLLVVDECNLLDGLELVWKALIQIARMIRHRAVTLVVMGQDLNCVPDELFALAGIVAVFKQRNPLVWDYIRARVGALRGKSWEEVSELEVAWALLAVTESSAPNWRQGARMVKFRPPLSEHGGRTRAAV